MSILDYFLEFSDAQAVTTTAASTNVIDTHIADSNLGVAQDQWIMCVVNTAFVGGTNLKVTLQDSADDATYATLLDTVTVVTASLTKGTKLLAVKLPAEHARYLRLYYTVSGTHSAGKVDGYMTMGPELY